MLAMVSCHVFRLVRKRNGRIVVIAAFYSQALSFCGDFPVNIFITHMGHTCFSYVPVPTILVIPVTYSLCTSFKTSSVNHLRTNKQPIKLLYNVEKNLTSILSWRNCVKIVSAKEDEKAVSLFNNHI